LISDTAISYDLREIHEERKQTLLVCCCMLKLRHLC